MQCLRENHRCRRAGRWGICRAGGDGRIGRTLKTPWLSLSITSCRSTHSFSILSGIRHSRITRFRQQGQRITGIFHGIRRCSRNRKSRLQRFMRKAYRPWASASRAWETAMYWRNCAGRDGSTLPQGWTMGHLPDEGPSSAFWISVCRTCATGMPISWSPC